MLSEGAVSVSNLDTRGSSHDAHWACNGFTASTGDGTSGSRLVLSLPASRVSPDHKDPLSTILPADPARRGLLSLRFPAPPRWRLC